MHIIQILCVPTFNARFLCLCCLPMCRQKERLVMLRLFALIHSFTASLECSPEALFTFSTVMTIQHVVTHYWQVSNQNIISYLHNTDTTHNSKTTRSADDCWWLVDGWHLEDVISTFISAFWGCLASFSQMWKVSGFFRVVGLLIGCLLVVVFGCSLLSFGCLILVGGCRLSVGCFWLFSVGLSALGWWLCQGGWQTRYWPSPIPWPASFLSTPSSRD